MLRVAQGEAKIFGWNVCRSLTIVYANFSTQQTIFASWTVEECRRAIATVGGVRIDAAAEIVAWRR